jgi:hypothetical protein
MCRTLNVDSSSLAKDVKIVGQNEANLAKDVKIRAEKYLLVSLLI